MVVKAYVPATMIRSAVPLMRCLRHSHGTAGTGGAYAAAAQVTRSGDAQSARAAQGSMPRLRLLSRHCLPWSPLPDILAPPVVCNMPVPFIVRLFTLTVSIPALVTVVPLPTVSPVAVIPERRSRRHIAGSSHAGAAGELHRRTGRRRAERSEPLSD